MEFRDLINSATAEVVKGTVEAEARFSFLQGGYMEDFQPQGICSSGKSPDFHYLCYNLIAFFFLAYNFHVF